jgi:hypothetical protein
MSEKAPKSKKTTEQLQAEYDKLRKSLGGLSYLILVSKGENEELKEQMEFLYYIEKSVKPKSFELALQSTEDILQRVKQIALRVGISPEEMTPEKLESYYEMMQKDSLNFFEHPPKPN